LYENHFAERDATYQFDILFSVFTNHSDVNTPLWSFQQPKICWKNLLFLFVFILGHFLKFCEWNRQKNVTSAQWKVIKAWR